MAWPGEVLSSPAGTSRKKVAPMRTPGMNLMNQADQSKIAKPLKSNIIGSTAHKSRHVTHQEPERGDHLGKSKRYMDPASPNVIA